MNTKIYLPVYPYLFGDVAATIAADTEADAFIPEIWANRILVTLFSQRAMLTAVSKNYDDEIATRGDTVYVPQLGALQAKTKEPNTSVTLQNPSGTTVPVILDTHKEVSFLVEDVARAQSAPDIINGYIRDAAETIGEAIELALLGEYANCNNSQDIGATLTFTEAKTLRTTIVITGKAPAEPRYIIIKDLIEVCDEDKFLNQDYDGSVDIPAGTVGTILGFIVKEAPLVIQTISPTRSNRLAFSKSALCLISRQLPPPPAGMGIKSSTVVKDGFSVRALSGYNMNYLGVQVTLDALFGTKIMRQNNIVHLY